MMLVCERFPQIGGIRDYMALPPGDRALYNQYTLYAMQEEARIRKAQAKAQKIQLVGRKRG